MPSPTSFPEPMDAIHLGHYKKGSGSSATLVQASSVTDSSDVDAGKSPYNVHVTGGAMTEENEQWEAIEPTRCGSQDRLHHPRSGIFKRVELSHTSEIVR